MKLFYNHNLLKTFVTVNQSNATVSVVRLGQTKNDASEGNITLTVDPPQYAAPESNVPNSTGDSSTLVDPFMEMDPEALERLETALQSEEAKQILGENVTAMLGKHFSFLQNKTKHLNLEK